MFPSELEFNNAEILKLDLPVKFQDFPKKFPWPTENILRKMWKQRDANGLNSAFKRFGTRDIVVYPKKLFDLIEKMDIIPVYK